MKTFLAEDRPRIQAGSPAFTLIELLIVVAIIAILAAIAVPNFLEAQIRSKVSAVKTDMRSLDVALTSYYTDTNHYPPENGNPVSSDVLFRLSTPVAYISSAEACTHDPFMNFFAYNAARGAGNEYYKLTCFFYCDYITFGQVRNAPDYQKYKWNGWGLASHGPDKTDNGVLWAGFYVLYDPNSWVKGGYAGTLVYDPSNGTVSSGDITRWGGMVPSGLMTLASSVK